MALLLGRRLSRLRLGSVRSSLLLIPSNGFSTCLLQPPCSIIGADPLGLDIGKLVIINASEMNATILEKKVPLELVHNRLRDYATVTIGASHGWVATLNKEDGILRLQDDLNPHASYTDPKRIPLPPLVTLPRCQTQIVTNVAMSSSSPDDEDCVVAVKFLGPQLSFCRPAQSHPKWINIRIKNDCFFDSRVVFSKKDEMFRLLGSGGHLIGSWDLSTHKDTPMLQKLRFQNLPELKKTERELLDSCLTSEHLVESQFTGETFLVKLYKKADEIIDGVTKMRTQALSVFKLDEEEENAVYTQDIGDLCIFLSKSEPFAFPATSLPGISSNTVFILDVGEVACVFLHDGLPISNSGGAFRTPYHIPPQIVNKFL